MGNVHAKYWCNICLHECYVTDLTLCRSLKFTDIHVYLRPIKRVSRGPWSAISYYRDTLFGKVISRDTWLLNSTLAYTWLQYIVSRDTWSDVLFSVMLWTISMILHIIPTKIGHFDRRCFSVDTLNVVMLPL